MRWEVQIVGDLVDLNELSKTVVCDDFEIIEEAKNFF